MITYEILQPSWADIYLDFLKNLDMQSEFMHYRQGERPMNVDGMRSRIKKQNRQGNSFSVLAMNDNSVVGYFSVNGGSSLSTKHSGEVAIGILKEWRGKKIATPLFRYAEHEAWERGIIRFSCSVVQENIPAMKFYMNVGFVVCGHKTMSFRSLDDRCIDEWSLEYLINE